MLTDTFGRRIDYLRLSVTERCNLRCLYCLPASFAFGRDGALTDEEVVRLVAAFARLGVRRVRVTGGEPLVRPGIAGLIARLAALPGVEDLSLSTNGVLLASQALTLAAAGLRRVNVSLDTLRPGRFRSITRFGELQDAWAGIEAALTAGLSPVKLNVVVARGMNEEEVGDFAALAREREVHVRFIELMPMGGTGFFSRERWAPWEEIRAACGPLESVPEGERPEGGGPARCFRSPGGRGTVGFISALSCGFCSECNRVRLTSRGRLVPCLDGEEGLDLAGPLRAGAPAGDLEELIREGVRAKPERHRMAERAGGERAVGSGPERGPSRWMCSVGG